MNPLKRDYRSVISFELPLGRTRRFSPIERGVPRLPERTPIQSLPVSMIGNVPRCPSDYDIMTFGYPLACGVPEGSLNHPLIQSLGQPCERLSYCRPDEPGYPIGQFLNEVGKIVGDDGNRLFFGDILTEGERIERLRGIRQGLTNDQSVAILISGLPLIIQSVTNAVLTSRMQAFIDRVRRGEISPDEFGARIEEIGRQARDGAYKMMLDRISAYSQALGVPKGRILTVFYGPSGMGIFYKMDDGRWVNIDKDGISPPLNTALGESILKMRPDTQAWGYLEEDTKRVHWYAGPELWHTLRLMDRLSASARRHR